MNEQYKSPPDILTHNNEAEREAADFCDTCAGELRDIAGEVSIDTHKHIHLKNAPDAKLLTNTHEKLSQGGVLDRHDPLVAYIVPTHIYTNTSIKIRTKQKRLDTVKMLCYISGMYIPQDIHGLHDEVHSKRLDEQVSEIYFDEGFASRVFQLHKSCANPTIKLSTSLKSRYQPQRNRIKINSCTYNFGNQRKGVINLRVSELSHAVQEHNHKGNLFLRYVKESVLRYTSSKKSYGSTYDTKKKKNYTEYEAHSLLEPALSYRLYFCDPDLVTNYIGTKLKNTPPHRQLFEARNFLILIYISQHHGEKYDGLPAPKVDQKTLDLLEGYVKDAYISTLSHIDDTLSAGENESEISKDKSILLDSYSEIYHRGDLNNLFNTYRDRVLHADDIPNELEDDLSMYLTSLIK